MEKYVTEISEVFLKIENASRKVTMSTQTKRERKITEVMETYEQAKKFLPEVEKLCVIVNKAIECGYIVVDGGTMCFEYPKGCVSLCTDGIHHKLGFYGKSVLRLGCNGALVADFGTRYDTIGYENGGCDGNFHFTVNKNDIYFGDKSFSEYDPCYKVWHTTYFWNKGVEQLKQFVKEFPSFRNKVYDFVNNIENYKCWL